MKLKKWLCVAWGLSAISKALANDIRGVQPAALDQPRINAALTLGPIGTGTLLTADFGGGFTTFNVEGFLDTGASGVLLSNNTADSLGLARSTFNNQPVVYSDVGVAGSDNFSVSVPVHFNLAPYTPGTDIDNPATYQSVYTQNFGPIRAQIGPLDAEPDPVLGDLDVFGVPVMHNKVVVINPRPANTFVDTMRTNMYNPGDAAIPTTSLHVSLSKADFSPFTEVTPAGAPGPTLNANPFIGKDPTHPNNPGPPPIALGYKGHATSGNFLLDTGAAASMISKSLAQSLGVTYDPNSSTPSLLYNGQTISQQFSLTIGGIGGTTQVAGFFLDSLTVPTVEGQTNSSNNLNFLSAPVLVTDITVKNPTTNGALTLDGIFGMNFLTASANVIEGGTLPTITGLSRGPFDTIVYNDLTGTLGLEPSLLPPDANPKAWFTDDDTIANWDKDSINWFDPGAINFTTYQDGDDVQFPEYSFFAVAPTVNITSPVAPNSVTIDSSAYAYAFQGAAITGSASVFKLGTATATFYNSNTYTGLTDVDEGTLVFAASQNIGPVLVRSSGHLNMLATQHFNGLNIVGGKAKMAAGGGKVLVTTSLQISGTGQLDLADNKLVITDKAITTPRDLRQMLLAGRTGGWAGPGLVSSVVATNPSRFAIGYADNSILKRTIFGGEIVDPQSLLVAMTYGGDANFDGAVDLRDLLLLASHWKNDDSYWYFGDFNYDGFVNAADLGILAHNWQQGVGNPLGTTNLEQALAAIGLGDVAIPEPSISAALILLATVTGRRRLRKSSVSL